MSVGVDDDTVVNIELCPYILQLYQVMLLKNSLGQQAAEIDGLCVQLRLVVFELCQLEKFVRQLL